MRHGVIGSCPTEQWLCSRRNCESLYHEDRLADGDVGQSGGGTVSEPLGADTVSSPETNSPILATQQQLWTASYIELLVARISDSRINIKDLSVQAGMSRQTLSRKLKTHEFSFDELKRLFAALKIDGQCAMLAIEHEGDWRLYDSNTLELAATLAKMLPGEIAAALDRDIQPLRAGAVRQLAREVAQRIALHDNEVLKRHESLQA